MDCGDSLNASRPIWSGFIPQGTGDRPSLPILNEPRHNASRADSSRPAWDESTPLVTSQRWENDISAANKSLVRVEERVANNAVGNQTSRPVDFLKLVGLSAAANRRNRAEESFRAEGSTSMGAAKALGQGLSFVVSLVRVEEQTRQRLGLRSPFVVYKKLRSLSDNLDPIERGELLRAVLLEVRVLTHPPLRTHSNIVKLFQLVWEPDPDLADQAWPVLVIEHAENGTLADFQTDYPKLPFALKRKLCRDVGYGIWALHSAGIVHGDLKSENVLICNTDESSRVVAKLADFGCAVADLEPSGILKLLAISPPWNAPESHDWLSRGLIEQTDVYSYGLLIWRVALDGTNAFRHINTLTQLDRDEFQEQVDILKLEDRILPLAKSTLISPFCSTEESCLIASVLDSTLQLDASKRDLRRALELLCDLHWVEPNPVEPLMQHEYEDVDASVLTAAVAPIYLQLSIIRELETLSTKPGWSVSRASLKLFELYIERLEWPGAEHSATKWYLKAIEEDPTADIARYAPRIFEFLRRPVPPEINPAAILKSFAVRGCYYSLMELRRLSPSDFAPVLRDYRRRGGLVRRDEKHEIFELLDFHEFEDYFNHLLAKEDNEGLRLGEIQVSKNGDLLLHAAARHGFNRAICHLLSLGVDVNSTNRDGETALLQACRAGSLDVAEFLLANGADPALGASNGETSLHWVFTFDEEDIESAVRLLLRNGGEPCLYAIVAAGRSSAVEHLALYGTPLDYAILVRNETAARALLLGGADPLIEYTHGDSDAATPSTPLRLAIRELLPDIIKLMIGSSASGRSCRSYLVSQTESILHYAVESSSKAIRRATLGEKYARSVLETIALLRTMERKERTLEFGMSLLHACIVHGIPTEVIEGLLQTGYRDDLELVSEPHKHTPLQAAMHLNRRETFLLLLNYGANIHRRLLFPEKFSYLQFCAYLGPRAVFFAEELTNRGAVLHKSHDPECLDDPKSLSRFSPSLLAIMMGNFELATFLMKMVGSTQFVPRGVDIIWLMLHFFPRLPTSRLKHLLEPPEGFEPVALTGVDEQTQSNYFHSLVKHPFVGADEVLANFRYLLQLSKRRNRPWLLDQQNLLGITPLTIAVSFGRLNLVLEMLKAGCNPNVGDIPCVNVARLMLVRLQKTPTQDHSHSDGTSLSKMEARWRQEDYNSIIMALKQYGGTEKELSAKMLTNLSCMLHSGYMRVGQQAWKISYEKGKEIGKETIAQHGYWGLLQLMFNPKGVEERLATDNIMHGLGGMPRNPLAIIPRAIEASHSRYQSDLAFRERFLTDDGGGGGLLGKLKGVKDFATWWTTVQPPEIEDTKPRIPRHIQPGPYSQEGSCADLPKAQTPGTTYSPMSSVPPQNYGPSGVHWPAYPEGRLFSGQEAIANQALSQSQQILRAQTSAFHIHALSQRLSPILFQSLSDSRKARSNVQECLDKYFAQYGEGALSHGEDVDRGAPLGSLPILELENGLDHLLQGHFEVLVMKRGAMVRVVVCDAGKRTSVREERAEEFTQEGWMGWQQLEVMEADIFTRRFEAE